MYKKLLSFTTAIAMTITSFGAMFTVKAAGNTESIQFNIFGSAEKEFSVTTENAGTKYSIKDVYKEDSKGNPVGLSCTAGIFGHPVKVELESGSEDMNAEVTFKFDYQLLRGGSMDELAIAKYDKSRGRMVLLDTEFEEFEHTITAHTSGSGYYALVSETDWYEAWKTGQLIIRDPVAETTHFNVTFVIDTSGSMSGSKSSLSQKCTYKFMSQLDVGDRFCVIGFSDSAKTVIKNKTIKDKSDMDDYLDTVMEALSNPTGGTNFNNALIEAMNHIVDDKYFKNLIVFLSDGEASISDSVLSDIRDAGAVVASVGFETGISGSEVLNRIASETGGSYYDASTDNISEIFDNIKNENIGVPITEDKDNDMLPDFVEESGMRTRFGQIIKTNPNKSDTDGDGYSDGAEMGDIITDDDVTERDKEHGLGRYVYFSVFSDPSNIDDTPINSIVNELEDYVHIYNETESDVAIDSDMVLKISNQSGAERYMESVASSLNSEQKESSLVLSKMCTLEDELISRSNKVNYSGRDTIHIADVIVSAAAEKNEKFEEKLDKIMADNGIEKPRNTRRYVTFVTDEEKSVTIQKDKTTLDLIGVKVETPFADIRVPMEMVDTVTITNEGDGKVGIYFGDDAPTATPKASTGKKTSSNVKATATPKPTATPNISTAAVVSEFSGIKTGVTLSIDNIEDITAFSTIKSETGIQAISKYNEITGKEDAKLNATGVYSIQENKIEFDDLKGKPREMKQAIRNLTAQKIVDGVADGVFSPDTNITRAQAATLMVRMLSRLDPNEDGGFSDVTRDDWFFGAAGSSKKCGIIDGYEDNTFRGNTDIPKTQLLVVEARTLKEEMGYKDIANPEKYMSQYTDQNSVASWAYNDIAFATQSNLVIRRLDGTFSGDSVMTRGDVAIELYELFRKIVL